MWQTGRIRERKQNENGGKYISMYRKRVERKTVAKSGEERIKWGTKRSPSCLIHSI